MKRKNTARPVVAKNDPKEYHVVNYMEELVEVTLRGLISQLPDKQRPRGREAVDVRALALNRLWPMYVTTEKGKKFVQRDVVTDKIDRDVTRELRAALEIVSKHPTAKPSVSVPA